MSCLLDWTDDETYIGGTSRDKRLASLWDSYRAWCDENNVVERASRKLFSVGTLTPDASGFVEVSQKKLNATGARYIIFWMKNIALSYAESHGSDGDMQLDTIFIDHCVFLSKLFQKSTETKTYLNSSLCDMSSKTF